MEHDRATVALGISLDKVGPGCVQLTMAVRPDMINGHGLCHGGYIFTLADSACAVASNSRNVKMVLQSATITYVNPARLHDQLIARGTEISVRGRTGIVDVTVSSGDGTEIALFRGIVRSIGEKHISEQPVSC